MVELFINGTASAVGQLTLYGDEPLSLNISVADIKDISKRNSTFSQTFTLPADKNNNILLNHIFNIGADSSFDPTKKTQCYILNDGMPVFNGQFQLTKINVKNRNVISYECVVYGEVIDLVKVLGNKLLTDLDFNDSTHNRDSNSIIDSWTADTKTLGYYYPLIDYGYDLTLNELTNLIPNELKPATSNFYLFSKIIEESGFSFESDILNSDIFTETIIPYSGPVDDKYYNFNIRLSYAYSSTLGPMTDNFNVFFHRSSLSTGISVTGTPTCFCHIIPRAEHIILTTPITIINQQDYVVTSCNLDGGATIFDTSTLPPGWFGVSNDAWRYPAEIGETFWVEIRVVNTAAKHHIFDTNTSFFNKAVSISGDTTGNNINDFRASISTPLTYINTNVSAHLSFNFNDVITPPNFNNIYNSFDITTKRYTKIDAISLNNYMPPNIKQVDYIKSIITMFNLMVIPNKNNPNRLNFIPRNDYYSTGEIKNWSDKIDHTQKIEEVLISEQQSKTIKLTYKEDRDYYNKNYKDNTNTVYGEYIQNIDNEWTTGEKKIEIIFSPTPIGKLLGSNDIYLPVIAKYDEKTNIYGRTDCNIRFLRKRALPLATEHDLKFVDNPLVFNEYPYCGHLDHPINPLVDYNFGAVSFVYYQGLSTMTPNNLVYDYWREYLDDINDKNSKLIKCKIYLTPNDIAQFNYNDSIYIEGLTDDGGHYFNVNKINYTPTSNLPSTIELIKVNRRPIETEERYLIPKSIKLNPVKSIELGKYNLFNSGSSMVIGNNNSISYGSENSFIIGSNNTIKSNISNVVLINSTNQTVSEPFTTIVGNTYFPQDGQSYTLFNDIDSGLDMIINPFAGTILNDIDSGLDAVRNIGGQSIINDIDSGIIIEDNFGLG